MYIHERLQKLNFNIIEKEIFNIFILYVILQQYITQEKPVI